MKRPGVLTECLFLIPGMLATGFGYVCGALAGSFVSGFCAAYPYFRQD